MAERSQYQYQPLTGPVWREPVAEKLAWLPRVQQPARQQVCGRVGDFARPEFEALYKPERLEWTPDDRYSGRALPRAANDWSIYPQLVAAPAYDPKTLEWGPQGRYPQVQSERRRLGDFQQPPSVALYDPSRAEWQAQDRYYGRSLKRPPFDWTVFQQPIAGPQVMDWQASGSYPRVPVELRRVGAFVQPPFQALYRPDGMQWLLTGQQPKRGIRFIYTGSWVVDPLSLTAAGGPTPGVFGWGARARIGGSGTDPWSRIGTAVAPDANKSIGTATATDANKRIGSEDA